MVNLPQDVASFVNTLPRQPTSLDIVVVTKESSTNSHHDFRVRRSKVANTLQWLLANNKYFQNITVDNDVISNLPEDDDFTHIHTVTVSAETSFCACDVNLRPRMCHYTFIDLNVVSIMTSIAGVSDYFLR